MISSFLAAFLGLKTTNIQMKNFRISAKFLSLILPLFFVACAPQNEEAQIRIVDLQGNAKPVKTRMPELNAKALQQQGFDTRARDINTPAQDVGYRNIPNQIEKKDDFATVSVQNVKQVLQPQAPKVAEQPAVVETHSSNVAVGAGNNAEAVEYDLSEAKKDENPAPVTIQEPTKKSAEKPAKKTPVEKVSTKGGKKFFAQVGSFSSEASANAALAKMKSFHAGKVTVLEGEKVMYRVWLGPIAERTKANSLVKKIKDSGNDAVLVRGN